MVSSIAGQLRSDTCLTTATRMAMASKILIDSQNISESSAAPAFVTGRLAVPHAIKAFGTTTAIAPNSADRALPLSSVNNHQSATSRTPAAACTATTRQGETGGFFARKA